MMRIILPVIILWILFIHIKCIKPYNNPEGNGMKDSTSEEIIVDSDYNLVPPEIKKNLILLNVQYYSFDNKLHQGQLVANRNLRDDLITIFKLIKENRFPIKKAIPIMLI